jgi:hypothetical protein
VNYAYDDANRLTSVGGVSYTWDNNGNLFSDGSSTYTYDYVNRLKSVVQGNNTYTYAFNGMGNRVSQALNYDYYAIWPVTRCETQRGAFCEWTHSK